MEAQNVNCIDLETSGEETKEDDEDGNRLLHLLIYWKREEVEESIEWWREKLKIQLNFNIITIQMHILEKTKVVHKNHMK